MVMAAAPAMPVPPSMLGRLMQGMAKVGSRFAPAYGAAKTAGAPMVQGVAAGAGFAAGQLVAKPMQGVIGWFVNFWPENVYGWFMLAALGLYYLDWRSGFNIAAMADFHLYFAIAAFFIIGFYRRFINGWLLLAATFFYFSLNGMVQADSMRERALGLVVLVASIAIFNLKTNATGAYRLMPLIAFLDIYGLPVLASRLLDYTASFGYVAHAISFVTNRLLFPMWLWFGMLAFTGNPKEGKEGTRVAGRFLGLVIVFYLIVALPQIKEAYAANVSPGLTAAQEGQVDVIKARWQTNIQRIVSGEFLKAPVASAYGGLERTFGFGEPKQEPKLGLALVQDNTMLKKYSLDFKDPEPSFVMRVTSPFPADTKKPYIEVTNIKCVDKLKRSKSLKLDSVATSKGVTPTKDKPVVVFYNGPDGGTQVKCSFSGWESGDYTISAEVDYKVDATAFLTTAFIRADQDEALRRQSIDPAVVNKIRPATAEYDNVPVTLTWGPPDLTKAPASIDLTQAGPANLLITIYVSKNTGWENSEIKAVEQLGLLLPNGVALVPGDSCDFVPSDADSGDGRKWYVVGPKRIFIGDAIRLDCGMKVSSEALSGADWAPARFDVSGSFVFTTKLEDITFTVEESEKPQTTEATQTGSSPSTPPPASASATPQPPPPLPPAS